MGVLVGLSSHAAVGAWDPDQVHSAETRKRQTYIRSGLVVGGDRALDDVVVRDIRRAGNVGFERVVIDMEGNRNGESVAIPRPPFYQVAVSPEMNRITVTVHGSAKLAFDARKVIQSFAKSGIFSGVELYPKIEKDRWTFVMNMKSSRPIEVFELGSPSRIIVDVRK